MMISLCCCGYFTPLWEYPVCYSTWYFGNVPWQCDVTHTGYDKRGEANALTDIFHYTWM